MSEQGRGGDGVSAHARWTEWRESRKDIANMDEWDKEARHAAEWGIVYDHPEAIVSLAAEVRSLRATIADVRATAAAAIELDGRNDGWAGCAAILRITAGDT